ncbi:MAG: hypothetical protein WCO42_08340 [bacterium]
MKAMIMGMSVMGIVVWSGLVREVSAGELTVEGSMVVKTNLTVNGQLSSGALTLTNLAISGEATIQKAVIQHLPPQGDLGMGPYTNGVAH